MTTKQNRPKPFTDLINDELIAVAASSKNKPSSRIWQFKDSDGWLWAEVAALAFLIPTAIALWVDLDDRQTQRIAQAWELVTRSAPGDMGKKGRPTYLARVDLAGANMYEAYLKGAKLIRANHFTAIVRRVNRQKPYSHAVVDLSGRVKM